MRLSAQRRSTPTSLGNGSGRSTLGPTHERRRWQGDRIRMSYADTLLANGERVTLRARQHWLAVILDLKWAWVALLIVAALLWVDLVPLAKGDSGGLVDAAKTGMGWGALILFLIAAFLITIGLINWVNEEYLVTNRRVMKVSGFINKHSAD